MGAIAVLNPRRQVRVLPLKTLSDERLAQLAGAGHSDAFGALYERYREALSRYCRSIVRDAEDAGDALQNTMLSVLRALEGHGPTGPVRPWLYRIAHNESVSILRRRHPHEELSVETPDRADTELASLARYRFDALLGDLRSLPERQRGALVMRELGGLEYAEIADALDMSAVSARKHVFEARVALHDIAAGRETDCGEIMRRISDGDGRVLRARSIRGHLRGCPSCSAFERGMRTRHDTLVLLPVFPMLLAGTVLGAVLHGGGAATSGLAAGGSVAGGSMSGGSIAGGSVAGGSIVAGSMAAGSLLGGGSLAAIKGLAAAGAIAVAGAGVIVGTGLSSRARHHDQIAQSVASSARTPRVRTTHPTVAGAPATRASHLATAQTSSPRAPATTHSSPTSAAAVSPSAPHQTAAVTYTRPTQRPAVSKPNKQAPAAAVPVAVTTPTATLPPTATTATTTATPTPPAPPASTAEAPATATTLWIDAIIEGALSRNGYNVADAEAQAQRQLTQSGISSSSASSSIQQLIGEILSNMGH